MPEPYRRDYLPLPDNAGFTRAPLRQSLHRVLQENAQHLYGTRVGMLIADEDLWYTPATTPAYSTEPIYMVTVPPGVDTLIGTVIWAGSWRGPGQDDVDRLDVAFWSERGGLAAVGGLDTAQTAEVSDTVVIPGWPRNPESVWDDLRVHRSGAAARRNVGARFLGDDLAPQWLAWQPDMSTTREQRIYLRARQRNNPWIWGVYVYCLIPQGA